MSQTNECGCEKPVVEVPVRGLEFALDEEALSGIAGGGISYSYEEQWTGKYWVDGKKIYQKTINVGQLPNAAYRDMPHGIANFNRLLHVHGYAFTPATGDMLPIPFGSTKAVGALVVNYGTLRIIAETNRTPYTESYVTLQYTCTDR